MVLLCFDGGDGGGGCVGRSLACWLVVRGDLHHRPLRTPWQTGADNRSRGWGTVRFATTEDAQAAIERFNGFQVQGSFEPLEVRLDNKA